MNDGIVDDGFSEDIEIEDLHRGLIEKYRLRRYQKARRRRNDQRRAQLLSLSDQELIDYSKSIRKGPGWTESRGDIIACVWDEMARRQLG